MFKYFIKLLFFISILFSNFVYAGEISHVLPAKFDLSNYIIFIPIKHSSQTSITDKIKYSKIDGSNAIMIDILDAKKEYQPQDIFFSSGDMKEFQIFQYDSNTVRIIINFNSDYNISNFKIGNINNNILLSIKHIQPYGMNYYINTYRETEQTQKDYKEDLIITERIINKIATPISNTADINKNSLKEINNAFANSTYKTNEIYSGYRINNLTQDTKLRSKYFIQSIQTKDSIFQINGIGESNIQKPFMLEAPLRMVFDLPNTIIDKNIHNSELLLNNGDKLKIAQFNNTTVRIVITSENSGKYIPVYSSDSQSLLFANPQNLLNTHLPKHKANIIKTAFQKLADSDNLLFEFDKPIIYSIKRTSKYLFIYFLNAENYNDNNFKNVITNTPYSNLSINTMKNAGIRIALPLRSRNNIMTYLSPEGRVFKLSSEEEKITNNSIKDEKLEETIKKEGVITTLTKTNNSKIKKIIVIDAGHGGKDYGAIREDINEKDINLKVSKMLKKILEKKGYKVYMTRTDDTFVSLEDRTIYTESVCPTVFVSVHVNSCNTDTPKGIETHYYHDNSIELANSVHKKLTEKINHTPNRGLLKSRFYVINHTTVPAILVEIGFISNDEERTELTTTKRQQKTAEGIAEGIIEYLNNQK